MLNKFMVRDGSEGRYSGKHLHPKYSPRQGSFECNPDELAHSKGTLEVNLQFVNIGVTR
jgi:hypothetical protein